MRPGLLKNGLAGKTLIALLALTLMLPWPAAGLAVEMTAQKEKELSDHVHLKLAAAGALMRDPLSNEYYRKVADRVMGGASLKPGQYEFYIIKSDNITVLAVPGGSVYMSTGTIISLENEGQLASLLSHEMAHLDLRHFVRRLEDTHYSLKGTSKKRGDMLK